MAGSAEAWDGQIEFQAIHNSIQHNSSIVEANPTREFEWQQLFVMNNKLRIRRIVTQIILPSNE